jgi:hypothetical protein
MAITRDLINQMLMQPDPLPGDPVTPDGSAAHEAAEPPEIEQQDETSPRNSAGMGEAPELEQPEAPTENPSDLPMAGEGAQE